MTFSNRFLNIRDEVLIVIGVFVIFYGGWEMAFTSDGLYNSLFNIGAGAVVIIVFSLLFMRRRSAAPDANRS